MIQTLIVKLPKYVCKKFRECPPMPPITQRKDNVWKRSLDGKQTDTKPNEK